MTRFAFPLIALALILGFASAPLAQQTGEPPAAEQKQTEQGTPKDDRAIERAKKRQEIREAKRKAREERRQAVRAKVAECRGQAKEQKLRGKERGKFVRSCVCAEEFAKNIRACSGG
jgi:hypothetical protein